MIAAKITYLLAAILAGGGEGGNKQRLHGTTLQAEERKENQNDISVSRKFGC